MVSSDLVGRGVHPCAASLAHQQRRHGGGLRSLPWLWRPPFLLPCAVLTLGFDPASAGVTLAETSSPNASTPPPALSDIIKHSTTLASNGTLLSDKCIDPDPMGRKLQQDLAQFAQDSGLEIVYVLSGRTYNAEHLLPLWCALPGKFATVNNESPQNAPMFEAMRSFGVTDDMFLFVSSHALEKMAKDGKHVLIACTGNVVEWWEAEAGSLPGHRPVYLNTVTISHGIDEDIIWDHGVSHSSSSFAQIWYPSLLYTRSAMRILPEKYSLVAMRKAMKLDPTKKTVLLAESGGQVQLGDEHAEVMRELGKSMNIMIRAHPSTKLEGWKTEFPNPKAEQFPMSLSVIRAADVIVGMPAGIMCSSLGLENRSILLARAKNATDLATYGDTVLNNSTSEVWFPGDDLGAAFERALRDSPENAAKDVKRKQYFARKYGCIDGYEDYRTMVLTFRDRLRLNTTALEEVHEKIQDVHCPMVASPDYGA